jgi:acetyl-CoA acetyltransferase family protein
MSQATYIVDGIRTPIGSFRGALSQVRTDDLAALPIKQLLERNESLDPGKIDDVILGCANQAGEDNRNVARMALLLAGIPWSVPGETVNRLCSSGLSAAIHAHRAIQTDDGDVFITGGVEHMTRGPYVMSKSSRAYGNDSKLYDSSFGWRFINPKMEKLYGTHAMGETAENLVEKFKISREDQDLFAFRSQQKASVAQSNGRLSKEILDVIIPQRKGEPKVVSKDEFVKPGTTIEILGKLRTAFRKQENGGTDTAGNASGLNDGASALLIAS